MNTGDFYQPIRQECERMESTGQYTGNGHHLAQRLSSMTFDYMKAKGLVLVKREDVETVTQVGDLSVHSDCQPDCPHCRAVASLKRYLEG